MLDSLLYVIEEILLKKVYLFFVVFKLLWYISCFWFLLTVFAFRVKSILILSTRITKYNRVESRECLINLLVHTVLQNVIKGSVKQTKNVLINIFLSLVDTSFKESYTHIIYIFFYFVMWSVGHSLFLVGYVGSSAKTLAIWRWTNSSAFWLSHCWIYRC